MYGMYSTGMRVYLDTTTILMNSCTPLNAQPRGGNAQHKRDKEHVESVGTVFGA